MSGKVVFVFAIFAMIVVAEGVELHKHMEVSGTNNMTVRAKLESRVKTMGRHAARGNIAEFREDYFKERSSDSITT
jgi:hypothetical protein